jgi:hypothetical protein
MIAAIHQPNYLPWLGYFYKIHRSDVFVFLDNVQLPQGRSFVNRNKIKTAQNTLWLTVPCKTKGRNKQLISEVDIDNEIGWREKHWKTMEYNYGKASYFDKYYDFFQGLYQQEWAKITELNEYAVEKIAKMIGLRSKFIKASALKVPGASTELLINICKAVGADTYLSGFGGKKYMDEAAFEKEHIKLEYYDFKHPTYRQLWGDFVPGLSIVDLLFNEGENSLEIVKGQSPGRGNQLR